MGALGVAAALLVLELSDDVTYAPLVGAVAVAIWAGGGTAGVAAVVTAWVLASWALARVPGLASLWASRSTSGGPLRSSSASSSPGSGSGCVAGTSVQRTPRARAERSRLRVERLQALAASLSAALTVEEVAASMVEGVPAAIGATRRGARSASTVTSS